MLAVDNGGNENTLSLSDTQEGAYIYESQDPLYPLRFDLCGPGIGAADPPGRARTAARPLRRRSPRAGELPAGGQDRGAGRVSVYHRERHSRPYNRPISQSRQPEHDLSAAL